ncbi:protein of unknown function [Limnospira indica PCC 8005]|uniref:Uncharacterized protein n=1 Tax=Limnospira indica PCC 8005 TaxID=376219 RepID=A0A9P1KJV1_9CYAN|nr:protein of unknown function [Limnospira indica PCC 8005]
MREREAAKTLKRSQPERDLRAFLVSMAQWNHTDPSRTRM